MGRKKGATVAIIAVVAVIGGLVAYSSLPRQEETNPPPVLTTIDRNDNEPDDGSTTIAEVPQEQPQAGSNTTVIANNTLTENNIIVINKPVYRNSTIIYQPVTINLESYKTTINLHLKQESKEPDRPADRSHSITINAKRIKSEGWSAKFTDDRVGMFAAVYDINGDLIRTGYADERGFTVRGLEDSLYFVFPADCTGCNGSKNNIMFKQWEDGSKDRPRLVPADSEVTASYRLVVPDKQRQVPLTPPPGETTPESPPPDETETAAEPRITLRAQNATFVYGWVQLSAQVENMVAGYDELLITVYAPDGTLHDRFSYSDQQGFFASREDGEGNYQIAASYEYDDGGVETRIIHPIKFATPVFTSLVASEDNGAVRLNGLLKGGLAGENITIAIQSPNGEQLKEYALSFGTKPVFSLFIPAQDAAEIFNSTGNYTFVVTHDLTGVQGSATLHHGAGETQTAAAPTNVSDNQGRSARPAVAAQESDVYLVWEDDVSGQNEILFAKSSDGGETFSEPVAISRLEEGGFAQNSDIAVEGSNVYVVWADYDSEEESTAAFAMSRDGGDTFGNKTLLGNYTGERANPRVTLFEGEIFVSWISGAEEEFTGNLMIARSSDGVDFEAAPLENEVDNLTMTSSGERLYLAWRQYPSGDTSDEEYTNMVARSSNGHDFETSEDLNGIAVTSLAASGDDLYAAGFENETAIFAKSSGGAFNATEISAGTLASIAASGYSIHLAWANGDDVFLASSSDGGQTFSKAENLSESDNISYWPAIATAEDTYVVWTEGAGENSDIMLAVQ